MEKQLEAVIDDAMKRNDTRGAICADAQGLPLISRGTLEPSAAAALSQLSYLAGNLDPSNRLEAVSLHYKKSTLVVHQHGPLTVGIHKSD